MKMGVTYQKNNDYNNFKELLIKNKSDFKEVRTSNKKYISYKKSKFYLSDNPVKDMSTKLLNHELGVIRNVKDEVYKNYLNNRYNLKDRIDEKLYIGCRFNLFEDFQSDDIYEIDITAAYPTTAKRLGFISEKNFDKFFEPETNASHIARKFDIRKRFNDNSYFSEGVCLKYSKKCRLISLGTLAAKKEIDVYVEGKKVDTYLDYDKEKANLFYNCAYETGLVMMDITNKYEDVYFWWVDAIFCKSSVVDSIVDDMNKLGYKVKVKKLHSIEYRHRNFRVDICKNNVYDNHPYFFSIANDIEHIKHIKSTEKNALELIEWYEDYMNQPIMTQSKIVKKCKELYGENATIEKVIFTDLCSYLKIDTPNDLNLKYLMRLLKERGLSYSDFIQIRSITQNVARSKYLNDVFGCSDRYAADVLTLNVVIRAFNPVEKYVQDIEINQKDVDSIYGELDVNIYKTHRLEKIGIDEELDEYDIACFVTEFTKINKTYKNEVKVY
jgi:hypothetical protein